MFEFDDNFLMGAKPGFEDGVVKSCLCEISNAAPDQLAELAKIVGDGDKLESRPEAAPEASPEIGEELLPNPLKVSDATASAEHSQAQSETQSQTESVEQSEDAPAWTKVTEAEAPPLNYDLEAELARAFGGDEAKEAATPSRSPVEVAAAQSFDPVEAALAADAETGLSETTSTDYGNSPVEIISEQSPAEPASIEPAAAFEAPQMEEPVSVAASVEVSPEAAAPSMDFSEMIADELDRALSEEISGEIGVLEAGAVPAPEPAPAFSGESAAAELVGESDLEAQLADMIAQAEGEELAAVPSAPPMPEPAVMAEPWNKPEIVEATGIPRAEADSPVGSGNEANELMPPLTQDFSDPAADLQSFLNEEIQASTAPPPATSQMDAVIDDAAALEAAAVADSRGSESTLHDSAYDPVQHAGRPSAPVFDPVVDDDIAAPLAPEPDFSQMDDSLSIPAVPPVAIYNKRRSGRRVAFVVAALALVGGGAAFAWNMFGSDSGPAKTILASTTAVKVKPKETGGEVVPNQDQTVYQTVDANSKPAPKQAKLKDETEKPIQVAAKPAPSAPKAETGAGENANGAPKQGRRLEPRRVRTVVVKPDGTILSSNDAPAASTIDVAAPVLALKPELVDPSSTGSANVSESGSQDAAPRAAKSAQDIVAKLNPSKPVAASSQNSDTQANPEPVKVKVKPVKPVVQAAIKPVKPKPAPKPVAAKPAAKPAPKEPAATSAEALPSSNSAFAVQISSQRSAEAARRSYNNLSRRFSSVLKGKGVDFRNATIAGKGKFVRVRIPADTRQAAVKICSQLKARGGDCFVTR